MAGITPHAAPALTGHRGRGLRRGEKHALTAGVPAVGNQTIKGGGVMSRIRIRVTLLAALAALAATATVAAGASAAVPSKVTALGDSITQAFQTCTQAFTDCPENSWATGTNSTVKSIFFRIKEKNPTATATNRSVTGAKVSSLNEQAQNAVSDKAEFVTILIGANDACASPSTSQSSFSSSFQAAISTLEKGLPGVRIYVGSIPNLMHLWEIFHTNSTATGSWEFTKECPGIMTEPTSESTTAKNRRAATLAAEEGYDATMASICNATSNCQWDNGTFFKAQFVASEVSTNDYFHPSIAGQASFAAAAFPIALSCTAEGFCGSFTHAESHEAPFGEPTAVAVDPSGNIWVADSAHDHVLEFNASLGFVRQIGSEGTGESQFKGIGGLATNSSGDLYVTDTGNDRVQEFSSTGGHLATFGSSAPGNGQLLSPSAVAIDSSGNVWVLNGKEAQAGGRIVEFSASGTFISQFGSKGTAGGQLLYADGLAFSGGHLYVSEASPQRVQELSTTGEFIGQFDEKGSLPSGIASDPSTGNLDVSDINGHVSQFSAAGSLIDSFGSPGSSNGQLWSPQAVAVGSTGTIYVADTHNQRVEEWKAGSPPTFANAFTHNESRAAPFGEPTAVAVDPSGNIWVADSAHDHVLEFNASLGFVRQIGSEGSGESQFKGIGGIATNSSGDVYVTDTGNDRVQEFSSTGAHLATFGSSAPGNGQLLSPNRRGNRLERQRVGAQRHRRPGRRADRRVLR